MFQHFGQRLKRDLKQLVDSRVGASVNASATVTGDRSLKVKSMSKMYAATSNDLTVFWR